MNFEKRVYWTLVQYAAHLKNAARLALREGAAGEKLNRRGTKWQQSERSI